MVNLAAVRAQLKALRVERGLSLPEVSKRAGWSTSVIAESIEDETGEVPISTLRQYALALGVDEINMQMEAGKPIIATFWNFAGGVSKTVLVRDVGFLLAELGFKVLLIDTDPQANLTHWLGIRDTVDMSETIYPAVIDSDGESELHLPEPKHVFGMDLIPSQMNVATIDMTLPGVVMGLVRLRDALADATQYDFVLIDSPPSLSSLSALAGIAAQKLVIPIPTNSKGLENFPTILNAIKNYRRARPELDIGLFVPTQYDARTKLNQEHLALIHQELTPLAPIAPAVAFRPGPYGKAQVLSEPLPKYAPDDKATQELRAVTDALLKTLGVTIHVKA